MLNKIDKNDLHSGHIVTFTASVKNCFTAKEDLTLVGSYTVHERGCFIWAEPLPTVLEDGAGGVNYIGGV